MRTKPRTQLYYQVSHPGCTNVTLPRKTPQAAVRAAIKFWIKRGELKRQPATTDEGGFENVEVEIL